MSHFSIVQNASLALRDLLFTALSSVPDVDFGLTNVANDIVLSAPDSEIPDGARLSVYLYVVEPDPQLRNQPPLSLGFGEQARAPLAITLSYLITPLNDDEALNQLMLGRILQSLHDQPFITEAAGEPIDDSRGGGSPELRLVLEPLRIDDIARIWHAMGSDYRLSIAYRMRPVTIDSAIAPLQNTRVLETHIAVETAESET